MSLESVIKDEFKSIKTDFEEYKKDNDKRLEKIEKNSGVADHEEKLAKMDAELDKKMEKIEKMHAAIQRAQTQIDEDPEGPNAEELKHLAGQAVNKLMRKQALNEEETKAYNAQFTEEYKSIKEFKTLQVGSDADGGYFVRPEVATEIRKKLFETSPMRQVAEVITIGGLYYEIPYDDDEPDANWVGETETRSESDTNEMDMLRIFAHELQAKPKATQMILEDASINIEAWHQGKVEEKFGRKEATAFISGTGVKQPKGITQYTAGDGFDKIQQVNSGSSGAFTADGLIDLQNSLFEQFQMNASWMMQRASAGAIRKLKDGNGSYLWNFEPRAGLNEGPREMLLGKPVRFANDMPAVGAAALAAAYGDFRAGYLIVDRIGISVLRDPYSSDGYVLFKTRKRVGGGVQRFQAIKLQKLSA